MGCIECENAILSWVGIPDWEREVVGRHEGRCILSSHVRSCEMQSYQPLTRNGQTMKGNTSLIISSRCCGVSFKSRSKNKSELGPAPHLAKETHLASQTSTLTIAH